MRAKVPKTLIPILHWRKRIVQCVKQWKLRRLKFLKVKAHFLLNFDPNLKIPLLTGQQPPELCSKYFFFTELIKYFRHFCEKTWRAGQGSLKFCVSSNQVVLRKTLENKNFPCPALLCANISKYFSLTRIFENICCPFFPRVCSTGPLTLTHPSASLSEFQLNLVKIVLLLRWGFN